MKRGRLVDVILRLTELCLGTAPRNPNTFEDYIISKIMKRKDLSEEEKRQMISEEKETIYKSLQATEDRGWTTFLKDEHGWFVFDYWVRGFFKSSFAALQETKDLEKIKAYKQRIDRFLHVYGMVNGTRRQRRLVYFDANLAEDQDTLEVFERPLRVMTPQGPRTTLARSDVIPEDSTLAFRVELLHNNAIDLDMVRESLEYGQYFGLGQWASGGWGTFEVEKFEEVEPTA